MTIPLTRGYTKAQEKSTEIRNPCTEHNTDGQKRQIDAKTRSEKLTYVKIRSTTYCIISSILLIQNTALRTPTIRTYFLVLGTHTTNSSTPCTKKRHKRAMTRKCHTRPDNLHLLLVPGTHTTVQHHIKKTPQEGYGMIMPKRNNRKKKNTHYSAGSRDGSRELLRDPPERSIDRTSKYCRKRQRGSQV